MLDKKVIREIVYLLIICVVTAQLALTAYRDRQHTEPGYREVFLNHDARLNDKIIQQIQSADRFVHFAIYTFTRGDIRDALLAAKYKGKEVYGVVDRDQTTKIAEQKKIVEDLKNAGIPVVFQDHLAIMHIKAVVTDKSYAFGSYNWTSSATNLNDEILEVGNDQKLRQELETIITNLFLQYKGR